MPTASDDYPWDVGRTPDEVAFLAAFRALADPALDFDAWTLFDHLLVTLDISSDGIVRETLRIDFDGALECGADPTLQMTEERMPLDQPGLFRVDGPLSASSGAGMAWRWLDRRLAEP